MTKQQKVQTNFMNIKNFKTLILSVIIAVVLFTFVIYLIQAIKPSPKYEEYCGNSFERPLPLEKSSNYSDTEQLELQKFYENCSNEYDLALDSYNIIIFIISIVGGLAAVSFGVFISLVSVSSGLMMGGTILIIYGVSRYWRYLSNWIRVFVLGITLLVLIWLAYKKLQN